MINIVNTDWRILDHDDRVSDRVDVLQKNGYDVYKIERKSRSFLVFGSDITYIYYKEKCCKNMSEA